MANMISRKYTGFCRIDWVGGTTDMWPLYCHMGSARVINMAVSVGMHVQVDYEDSEDFSLKISSLDLNKTTQHTSLARLKDDVSQSVTKNPMRWLHRVLEKAFQLCEVKKGKWEFTIKSDAPPGSGLGGSSVLGVTLAKSVYDLCEKEVSPWYLHQLILNLESAEIEKPAGEQDYVPALFGGLLSFYLSAEKKVVQAYEDSIAEELANRSALIHTGKPHHSGINNWDVFKKYHENNKSVQGALMGVRDLAEEMHEMLLGRDIEAFVRSVNKEWAFRTKLSKSFDAPVLKEAWAFAKKNGAVARKACGAGGGGSLLVIFPDSESRDEALLQKLPKKEWLWIPFSAECSGLCSPQ